VIRRERETGNGERDESRLHHVHRSCFLFGKKESLDANARAMTPRGAFHFPFPAPRSPRAQRAFTLLEMLAVIILIGVAAAAVSISVAHGLASARINAAAGELASALRTTRTQAIVHGQPRFFELNMRDATYRGADQRDVHLPRGLDLQITSAKKDQSGDIARINFYPDGSSTGGRITLRSGQREWHVNVSWLTGAITLFDTAAHS
jgi:general secretion pathway protein H